MSQNEADDTFWERADTFIAVANEFCEQTSRGKVSASLLYAAARFNAFVVAASARSAAEVQQDKEAALEYFVDQYRNMLEENLDDHIQNFEGYVGHSGS